MGIDEWVNEHDLETPDSIQVRFGLSYVESDPAAAAGIVNHYRRRPGQWTVSSELSMDVCLDGLGELDGPVLATAHAFCPMGTTSLGSAP